jgi:hypothetical protein
MAHHCLHDTAKWKPRFALRRAGADDDEIDVVLPCGGNDGTRWLTGTGVHVQPSSCWPLHLSTI